MRFADFRLNSNALLIVATIMIGAMIAFITALTTDDNILVWGIAYATTFVAVCWRFPHIALAITFALAPFQEDLSNGFGPFHFSVGEISLTLAALVFVFRCITQMKMAKIGPVMAPVAIYLTICLASSLADWHTDTVVPSLLQMVLYFVVAVIIYSNFVEKPEQLRLALYGLVISCVVLSIAGL
ncbi:MAG TPA: hypothetical protein VKU00_19270, partial [Chthonomonadaceae bacterium]|nr:hypothetical protein [Chthonomonadaceae bacterium]